MASSSLASVRSLPGHSMTYPDFARESVRLIRPHAGLFALVASIQAVSALTFGVADPLVLTHLVDSLTRGDVRAFVLLVVATVVLATLVRVLTYVSALVSRRLSNAITERLVGEAFEAFCDAPHVEVSAHDKGYFISRIYDEPAKVAGVAELLVAFVRNGLLAAGALAVCLWLAWQVAVALAVIVPVLVMLARRYGARISKETVLGNEEEARLRGGLGRSVDAHKTIRLFGLREPVRVRISGLLGTLLNTLYRRTRHAGALSTFSGLFLSYAETIVFVGAGIQVIRGVLSVGGMFGFASAFWRVVAATRSLVDLLPQAATMMGQLDRVQAFTGQTIEPEPERVPVGRSTVIHLDRVAFRYGDAPLIKDFSLRLQLGERVLIQGPNGSGKSTAGHLAVGLFKPQAGRVAHVGHERVSALLLPFGFIPGTVRDNLDTDRLIPPKYERLESLLARFGLAEKLDRDPISLSQGEQRKLQVLMTLMKPADAYVFDEPLSNVDVGSKDVVMQTIFDEVGDAGLVVIMHGDERFAGCFTRTQSLDAKRAQKRAAQPVVTVA